MQRLQLPPLSLYVHIPWCVRKCPYCDFNSHAFQKSFPEADYVAALLRDLDADLHWAQGRELESIFFGGGTPSLFSAQAIETIMRGISQRLCLADNAEITLEANPGTAEQSRFREYRLAGINRLSIGVQSFQDRQLQLIGRIHGADEARCAVDMAISCGFNNFNIDLMHGLPEQTAGSADRKSVV